MIQNAPATDQLSALSSQSLPIPAMQPEDQKAADGGTSSADYISGLGDTLDVGSSIVSAICDLFSSL